MRRRRSIKRTAVILAVVVGLVYLGGRWLLHSAYAAEQVCARLSVAAGAPVRIGGFDLGWGPWPVAGGRGSSTPFAFNMKPRQVVHVTPALLRRTPFVPANVWNEVACEGDTPCEIAVQFNPSPNPPVNYRVALEPK